MAEEYTDYEGMQKNSHKVLKTVLKIILIALIIFVFGAVLIRSCMRRPQKHILYSDALKAALQENKDIDIYYQSPFDTINRNDEGTFQFSISDCYYIPKTHQLQVTLRYNLAVLKDAQEKYDLKETPTDDCFDYSLLFEDGERITDCSYSSYISGRYRFIYLLFDGVDLDEYTLVSYSAEDAALTDRDGKILAHETDSNGKNILYETDEEGNTKVYNRTFVSLETYYIDDVDYKKQPLSSLMVFNRLYNFERVADYDKYIDYDVKFPIIKS
ncbi:MAG: hypothetical protein IJT49_07290 [Clostridia bacterium]|nr:hypothetical protein [Clostridia bacterium]